MSLQSNNMLGPDVLGIKDVDFYLDGEQVHAESLFSVYDPLEPVLESNHERNQVVREYRSTMGDRQASQNEKVKEKNRELVREAETRFAETKSEFDAYADIDGERYSVVPRQNIPAGGILSMPNVMFLKSEESDKELVLRHWRPLDDETLYRLHKNTDFNRMKHDDVYHRSIGSGDMADFNESVTMIDERDLQTALMSYYADVRDNEAARPLTPTKWTAVDVEDDGSVYVLRNSLEDVFKGGLGNSDTDGLAKYYANLANLQIINWFDRKDEFFIDSWQDGEGRFPVFVDNEFSGAVKSQQYFFGGQDYKAFPDTLVKTLTENHDYPEPVAEQIANQWKDDYREAQQYMDELPDETIVDYLAEGWDPDILPDERRVRTRI
ncbi:hypothetical protein ACK3SF_05370 [Candidatus Nanosalina sp. VS9-1]|uniref:hypothetical protein n=1 Tax=Candidatus Nanosalina sp. VS9-1 TaxID=3388566 RepID=UPI0039E0C673